MKTKFLIYSAIVFTLISCEKNSTKISGDIPNLPDGKLVLFEEVWSNKLDSVEVKDGKFDIELIFDDKIPHYIGMDLLAKNGDKICFQFPTDSYFNKQKDKWSSSLFLSDKKIYLKDSIEYIDFGKNSFFPDNIKPVNVIILEAGEQTYALQKTNYDLFSRKSNTQNSEIQNLIKRYPKSFHLLAEMVKNKYTFSSVDVSDFLKLFDKSVQAYPHFKELQKYVVDSKKNINTKLLKLKNSDNQVNEILDKRYNKHLIILWASWCMPCRQEIPILKKIVSENKLSDTEIISISIDEKESDWQKALAAEKMNWKQFILSEKESEKFKIILKYGGAIPYSVLVNSDLKILSSSTGLYDESEMLKMLKK